MESVELYACLNPETGLYKATREGDTYHGEPLGQLTKFYKHLNKAEEFGCRHPFLKVVKVKIEVIE